MLNSLSSLLILRKDLIGELIVSYTDGCIRYGMTAEWANWNRAVYEPTWAEFGCTTSKFIS
jgi:hypothetical protein